MKTSALWSVFALGGAAQKVVQWDVARRAAPQDAARLTKRATIAEPLGNAENLYYANVTIGTPGQLLQLQIDTGSSDLWMTAAGASYCRSQPGGCQGGTFDSAASSTYHLIDSGGFQIQYVDQSGSTGDYFSDNVNIAGTTITGQEMGLALRTTIGTGIIGVGFAQDESICAQSQSSNCNLYPTVVDNMVNQSKINSHAYSLWLNDVEANTGSILFGGVDTDKYQGQLVTLPILPDASSGSFTSFTVAWTGFSIGTPKGEETNFTQQDFAQAAILDSGTSTLLFPDDIANELYTQFGAQYSNQLQSYVAPCYLRNANATLDFQFGGPDGPTIRVPVDEFLLDLTSPGEAPLKFHNGDKACLLGFQAAQGRPVLLGDTFLRSAYVVYDLDNRQISIAQTIYNAGSSNVQEIRAGSSGVPNVASTASAVTISQTATGAASPIGATATGFYSGSPDAAASLGATGPPPLAQFTTAPASAANANGNAAAGLRLPTATGEGIFLLTLVGILTAFGSGLIML